MVRFTLIETTKPARYSIYSSAYSEYLYVRCVSVSTLKYADIRASPGTHDPPALSIVLNSPIICTLLYIELGILCTHIAIGNWFIFRISTTVYFCLSRAFWLSTEYTLESILGFSNSIMKLKKYAADSLLDSLKKFHRRKSLDITFVSWTMVWHWRSKCVHYQASVQNVWYHVTVHSYCPQRTSL